MQTTHERFSAWLRSRRATLQISQREASRQLGVSPPTYLRWENGTTPFALRDVLTLAAWADVSAVNLFELIASDIASAQDRSAA